MSRTDDEAGHEELFGHLGPPLAVGERPATGPQLEGGQVGLAPG